MKVLFVSSGNSEFFNISPFIKEQGDSLIRRGWEVEYFTILGKGVRGYLTNIIRLKTFLKDKKFDIIHAHYSLTGWVVILTGTRIPKVLSLMGSDVHGSVNKFGKKTFSGRLLNFQAFAIQFFYNVIISKSQNLSKYLVQPTKTSIIPNGVDFSKFKPIDKTEARKKVGLPIDSRIVLFLGSKKDENKNFNLAKESISKIKEKAMLIAPYPVTHELIPFFLNACDVLIFTSYKEGSPNVIKEALACNTSIVSTPSGDILTRTKNIDSVYIADFSAEHLALKLDLALKRQKKNNSRQIIQKELDESVIARKLINLYNRIAISER